MEDLKKISTVFWTAVAGVVVCLGGTIYTAVQRHHEMRATEAAVGTIPVPAFPGPASGGRTSAPPAPAQPAGIPVPAR